MVVGDHRRGAPIVMTVSEAPVTTSSPKDDVNGHSSELHRQEYKKHASQADAAWHEQKPQQGEAEKLKRGCYEWRYMHVFLFKLPFQLQVMLGSLPPLLAEDAVADVLHDSVRVSVLAEAAEQDAAWLVSNLHSREEYAAGVPDTWDNFRQLWADFAGSFEDKSGTALPEVQRRSLALGLAKLQRNLVAGIGSHQQLLISAEPHIRKLIYHMTAYFRIEDAECYPLHRALTQLLSNLISPISPSDDTVIQQLLPVYLDGSRENDVIIRLLDSLDPATNLGVLRLLHNVVRSSPERLDAIVSMPTGIAWLKRVIGKMDDWLDDELFAKCFDVSSEIFKLAIEQGHQADLYRLLGTTDDALTPHQTILLKLIDSHHLSLPSSSTNHFLLPAFSDLTRYTATSIKSGIDDPRLPKVFEGLVLVTECLTGIALRAQEAEDAVAAEMVHELKDESKQVVETIIGLLRALEVFIPRIKPGLEAPTSDEVIPFPYLKRDLVRLLGVLAFHDVAIGDRVRAVEGVQVVLGLCVTDERNPYLREHALFAVRNLMLENEENQEVLRQMEPLGVVGDNGELLPLPDNLKKPSGTK